MNLPQITSLSGGRNSDRHIGRPFATHFACGLAAVPALTVAPAPVAALWPSGEQKSDKIRAPHGIMTKSDRAFAQPGSKRAEKTCPLRRQLSSKAVIAVPLNGADSGNPRS